MNASEPLVQDTRGMRASLNNKRHPKSNSELSRPNYTRYQPNEPRNKMKIMREVDCPLFCQLTIEEAEGLDWLLRTAEKVAAKAESENCEKAKNATAAMGRINQYMMRCHSVLHEIQMLGNAAEHINVDMSDILHPEEKDESCMN